MALAQYIISRAESGKKLPRFLRQWQPNVPLSAIYKALRTGRVRVNGARGKAEHVLGEGDVVQWDLAEGPAADRPGVRTDAVAAGGDRPRHRGDLDIVYEDDDLLVLDKPAGLLTHGDRPGDQDTLIDRAWAYLDSRGEVKSLVVRPAAVNRLDRNTSGLVLVGKNAETLGELSRMIRERRLRKVYLTVLQGHLPGQGELRDTLVRDAATRRTRVAGPGEEAAGRQALSRYRTLDALHGYSLVEVELVTGRTHQIRAQFAAIGHPLLADAKYGGRPAFGRSFPLLHAHRVHLPDGRSFTAPLPEPFRRVLRQIGLKNATE